MGGGGNYVVQPFCLFGPVVGGLFRSLDCTVPAMIFGRGILALLYGYYWFEVHWHFWGVTTCKIYDREFFWVRSHDVFFSGFHRPPAHARWGELADARDFGYRRTG